LRALDPHDIVKPEHYFNSEAEAVGGGVQVVHAADTTVSRIESKRVTFSGYNILEGISTTYYLIYQSFG